MHRKKVRKSTGGLKYFYTDRDVCKMQFYSKVRNTTRKNTPVQHCTHKLQISSSIFCTTQQISFFELNSATMGEHRSCAKPKLASKRSIRKGYSLFLLPREAENTFSHGTQQCAEPEAQAVVDSEGIREQPQPCHRWCIIHCLLPSFQEISEVRHRCLT